MEEKERKNEAGSETPKEETKSRREFLKSAAIQGAVAALFGAVTFDSVMARAMERVSEIQAVNEIGNTTAKGIKRYGAVRPLSVCSQNYISCSGGGGDCEDFDCPGGYGVHYSCYGGAQFDCGVTFNCTSFNCKDHTVFQCSGFQCQSGTQFVINC